MLNKFFPDITGPIPFEGKDSRNPFAFRFYNKDQRVGDKTMAEHLRFAVAYWHTFMGPGSDMFGDPSFERAWRSPADPMDRARATLDTAFEFFQKLGVGFYCFHDRDIAPEGSTFAQTVKNLETIVGSAKALQKETGVRLLWGTANLFGNPIYAQGAGTSPNAHVMA